MTAPPAHDHPLVRDYLDRLALAGAHLPPWRRDELVRDIAAHVDDAVAARPDAEADLAVRDALDRLGAPEAVVAAEASSAPATATATATATAPTAAAPPLHPPTAPSPWGGLEVAAVVLLVAGPFVLWVVGPLVGLVLAWASQRWTRREKLVATGIWLLPLLAVVVVGVVVPLMGRVA